MDVGFGFLAQCSAVSKVLANTMETVVSKRFNGWLTAILSAVFFCFFLNILKCAVWIQFVRVGCLHFPVSMLVCMLVSACLCV